MDKEVFYKTIIKLYAEHHVLWHAKHPDYFTRRAREKAWQSLARKCNLSVKDSKKKMESLLGSYRREKSRERQSLALDGKKGYKSHWFAFKYFSFMDDKNNPDFGKNHEVIADEEIDNILVELKTENPDESEVVSIEPEENELDMEFTEENSETDPLQSYISLNPGPTPDTASKLLVNKALEIVKEKINQSKDPYLVFGNYIANELRKYDQKTLAYVKHAINNILFEANIGSLNSHEGKAKFVQRYIAEKRTPCKLSKDGTEPKTPEDLYNTLK